MNTAYLPEIHKALPQSMDAEKGVLGSILYAASVRGKDAGREIMFRLEGQIGSSHFHFPAHRAIWQALGRMHRDNDPVDLITLTQVLDDEGTLDSAGGSFGVTELFSFVPTDANVDEYVSILKEKQGLRIIASLAESLKGESYANGATAQAIAANAISSLQRVADSGASIDDNLVEQFNFKDLATYPWQDDPNSVLGDRWLCKGSQCLWLGPSGIGKSTLCFQAAMYWALGLSLFGIKPKRPLKSIIFQAEDDKGDCSEFLMGLINGLEKVERLKMDPQEMKRLMQENFIVIRDTTHRGPAFAQFAKRKIKELGADMVWINPLFSYAGCSVSDQAMMSAFLRDQLTPVAVETGIIWHVVHHVPKPSTDSKARQNWSDSDFAYIGFGSSEITNWARAINYIEPTKDGPFKLRLAKRGNRARATPDPTNDQEHGSTLYLEHHEEFIFWMQVPPPKEALEKKRVKEAKQASELVGCIWPASYSEIVGYVQSQFKCSQVAGKKRVTRWVKSGSIKAISDDRYTVQK
jgi:hypothetical protein